MYMEQNIIVPTVFGEKKVGGQQLKAQSIFGLKMGGQKKYCMVKM